MAFRRHLITGEPVLFAPDRLERPAAFGQTAASREERCPFCPGNEADTPPELARLGGDEWTARVVPNKFPAAAGAEVIVETARHGQRFDEIEDAGALLQLTFERYRAHQDSPCVSIFKNEGTAAGASVPHLHSQLVPLPFVPPRIEKELAAFARASDCPLCEALRAPREAGVILAETESFVWLVPSASTMPYQQWLVPKRHLSELAALEPEAIDLLAAHLQVASAAMLRIAEAYTWTFVNFRGEPKAHAYIDLFPRLTALAGLELGTGTFVEIMEPAVAAARLRQASE